MVGLSNPDNLYKNTRHNIGSHYVSLLAQYYNQRLQEEKKFLGYTANICVNHKIIRLLVPNVFMNINGESVFLMSSFYHIPLTKILIVHDELDLSPGVIKIKYGFGSGGHKGLKNVMSYFKQSISFFRIRIGIGRPIKLEQISNYVLSYPNQHELNLINRVIYRMIINTNIFTTKINVKLINKLLIN
ncbi:aminoacyl-tRNA hydrolase [Buchnera aphidicola]|uniref:aminoacyl-tRNA hydrolase n=1 Tax=Buchnera aphidicola TaxID=9 RepID=UPI003464979D